MPDLWTPREAEPDMPDGLVLFDGACALCSFWVRFTLARDRDARFRFLSIQDERGRTLARRLGIDPDAPQTNAVIADGRVFFKSDAALAVLTRLPGWRWARPFGRAPRAARDWLYDRIARNRYALFGKVEAFCPIPDDRTARRLGMER